MHVLIDGDRLSVNLETGVWRYEFHDEANTVAYADSKWRLEAILDWAENNLRLNQPPAA